MNRIVRIGMVLIGLATLAFAAGFAFQAPFITRLWPLPSGMYSNIFVASILAAIAAPVIWIGLAGALGATQGGAINLGVTFAGISIFSLQLFLADRSQKGLLAFGLGCGVLALVNAYLLIWSAGLPYPDSRPTPMLVRVSFALFAVVLLLAGGALALKRPNIFPWPITPENSVIFGWIFLGAMCYFVYALLVPRWDNARGQLLGFLAYDLVLIFPFIALFRSVRPGLLPSLVIYTAIVTYSGLLAAYYLFISPDHRFIRFRRLRRSMGMEVGHG